MDEFDNKQHNQSQNKAEYEENKKARLGNVEPKRFKYKKLMD